MSVRFVKQPKYKIVDKTKELSQDSLKKINQKLNLSTTNFKAKLQKLFDKSLPDSLVELFGKGDVLVTVTKDKKTGGCLLNFSNLGTADGESLDLVKGVPDISRKMSTGTTESGIRNGSRSVTTPKIQKDAVDNGAKKGKEKPKSVVDESLDKAENILKNPRLLGYCFLPVTYNENGESVLSEVFGDRVHGEGFTITNLGQVFFDPSILSNSEKSSVKELYDASFRGFSEYLRRGGSPD